MKKTALFLFSITAFMLVIILSWYLVFNRSNGIKLNTNGAAVIKEIRSLQRLATASFTIEKIIDGGTSGNTFQQLLFGDKILLIAHGQVIAGFDLSQMSEKDIEIQENNLRITLTKHQILVTSLDNSQTRVYDRTRGILNPGDKDLESKARETAQNTITEAACKGGILKQASENARKQISAFLSTFDFNEVIIDIPEASC